LASFNDIEAHGYNAKDLSGRYSIYVDIREVLARVKAVIDIIVGVSPKFLGEQITIQ
jgi:SanA protein